MKTLFTVCLILFFGILQITASTETEFDNEFWISTNTNTMNLGTLDNPFDGSTEAKFDYVMNNLPPNSTIHILAGTYQTHGDDAWQIKSAQKIIGSGIDVTILQLVPSADNFVFVVSGGSAYAAVTNVEVSDLTVDCNYTSGNFTPCGVELFGAFNAVRRVKVINTAHFGGSSEAWGITMNPGPLSDSKGNIVEECEISNFKGGEDGEISAISFNGSETGTVSGIIRDNRVFLPSTVGCAFNGSWIHDVLIEGNFVDGANTGYYGDTGGRTNIIVAHNTFKDVDFGVRFLYQSGQNITIAYNNILLATDPPFQIAFNWSDGTNINIIGDIIGWNTLSTGSGYFLDLNNVRGLVVADNRVDSTLLDQFWGSDNPNTNNYIIHDNYDLNGNILTNLFQFNFLVNTNHAFFILPPDAYPLQYSGGSVNVGEFITANGNGAIAWICQSNANASIIKPLPLPNDFWGWKTTFINSWKIRTTVFGTYSFSIGNDCIFTNDASQFSQKTVAFTMPNGTNTITISTTNSISSPDINYLDARIYLGNQVQPGNYSILSGTVVAQ